MKKILILIVLCLSVLSTNAQYKINKTKYDFRDWTYKVSDPYNPSTCGALSIIPGVGQMLAGEIGRGAAFFGGFAGCCALTAGGFAVAWGTNEDMGVAMMIAGFTGLVAIDIWAIADAVRVAKVNNLASRDNKDLKFSIRLEPYVSTYNIHKFTFAQVGLSLKLNL